MPAFDTFTGARHPQGRAEDRRLQIVDGDGVAPEEHVDVAVFDEPDHVLARAGVYQRGTDDPEDLATALLLGPKQLRQHAVVHRSLARHFRRHETEFVRTVGAAEKALDVNEDPFGAVFRRPHGDLVALSDAPRLGDHQVVTGRVHDHAVHPWQAWTTPAARQFPGGRQAGSRRKTV